MITIDIYDILKDLDNGGTYTETVNHGSVTIEKETEIDAITARFYCEDINGNQVEYPYYKNTCKLEDGIFRDLSLGSFTKMIETWLTRFNGASWDYGTGLTIDTYEFLNGEKTFKWKLTIGPDYTEIHTHEIDLQYSIDTWKFSLSGWEKLENVEKYACGYEVTPSPHAGYVLEELITLGGHPGKERIERAVKDVDEYYESLLD